MGEKEKLLKVVRNVASVKVKKDMFEWPPKCTSFLYQPKRPCRNDDVSVSK